MLVLSRKQGERIIIGDDIIITVVSLDYGRVRLGVEAPREIEVWREEMLDRLKSEEKQNAEDQSDKTSQGRG
jgi:carbon storage regulator